MLKSGKSFLALIAFFFMGFMVFSPVLKIGFLGDFAGDLYGSQSNWFNFASYHWNFYVPALAIYAGLYNIFHLSPLPYHAVHLALICLNAWLVFVLAQALECESWQCWVAGLLALFNSAAFESYFWLSTIPKALASGFGLFALICLSNFRQRQAALWGWSYLIAVTMGMSLESTGLILPLLGLCLDTYYRPWQGGGETKPTLLSGLRLHCWSFSLAGGFLLFRHFLGIKPYVINVPLTKKFLTLTRTIFYTFFHGLPDGLLLALNNTPAVTIILTLIFFVVLAAAAYGKTGQDRKRFVALLLVWVGACLPHTIGANFQSRYLYFPGVCAALVLADVLGALRRRLQARFLGWLLISMVILGYFSTDLYAFRQSLSYYLEATRIYNAGITKIKNDLPKIAAGTRLVLIDFPDSIRRPRTAQQGYQDKYRVLIYRNAFPYQLKLLYQNHDLSVTLIQLAAPDDDDNPEPLGTPTSPEHLATLLAAPHTMAWRYFPGNRENFVRLSSPNP